MRLSFLSVIAPLPFLLALTILPTPTIAADYTILIGWQTLPDRYGPAWYSLYFYPNNLTIAYGDSVQWEWNSVEVHNVVFSNPPGLSEANPDGTLTAIAGMFGNQSYFTDPNATYSSGIRTNGVTSPYKLVFTPTTGSGSFEYYCSIHSGMIGFVNVLPAGRTAPLTPAQVNTAANATIAQLETFAAQQMLTMNAAAPANGAAVTHTRLPDGTTSWTVVGGAMWMNGDMVMYARFLPSYLEINVNDTVTWVSTGDDPHYVYFHINNTWPLLFTNWTVNQTTPVNPAYNQFSPPYNFGPSVAATVNYPNPSGIVNSGLFFPAYFANILPFFANSYSVKFVQTGSFSYQCPIHLDMGMIAQVVVKPAGAAVCTDPTNASTCSVLATPVSVRGDPQFVGLLGQSYQVHGIDGAVYNTISEQAAQVNARFAFLTGPRPCPTIKQAWSDNEPATSIMCWSHDGSYLSELGLFTPSARLFVQAGPAATGFAAVTFNVTGATTDIVYEQLSSHHLSVTLGSFTLYVDNSDGFVNLATIKTLKPLSQLNSHGLLGQTYVRRGSGKKGELSGVIEGEVDDYVVDGGLFATGALYNMYNIASQ